MYDVLARDVIGGAVAAGDHRHGLAAGDGDAAVEALELQCDLALVVVHGDHTVEVAVEGLDEQDVGGEGTHGVHAVLLGLLDGGADHIDLLPAAQPALAAVGIQGRHADAGIFIAGHLQGGVAQGDGPEDLLHGQVVADLLDGDVAGGAGGPHAAGHVDLAEGLVRHAEQVGHDVVLALILAAGQLHPVLVEGGEAEALQLAALTQVDGQLQHVVHADAAHHVQLAHLHVGGVLVVLVQDGQALVPVGLAHGGDDVVGRVPAHDLQGVLKDAHVADDDGAAVVRIEIVHCQLGHQLGPDARGVAHEDTKYRFSLIHRKQPSFPNLPPVPAGFLSTSLNMQALCQVLYMGWKISCKPRVFYWLCQMDVHFFVYYVKRIHRVWMLNWAGWREKRIKKKQI